MSTHSPIFTSISNPEIPGFRSSNSELRFSTLYIIPLYSPRYPLLNEYLFDPNSQSRNSRISKFELRTSTFDIILYPNELPSLSPLEWVLIRPYFPIPKIPKFEVRLSNFDFEHYPLSQWTPLSIPSWTNTHTPIYPDPKNPGFRSSTFEIRLSTLFFIPFTSPHYPLSNDYSFDHILKSLKIPDP